MLHDNPPFSLAYRDMDTPYCEKHGPCEVNFWLLHEGFTVGAADIVANEATMDEVAPDPASHRNATMIEDGRRAVYLHFFSSCDHAY